MALWKTKDYATTTTATSTTSKSYTISPAIGTAVDSGGYTGGWVTSTTSAYPSSTVASSSMKATIPDLEKTKEQIEDLTKKLEKIEHKLDNLDNLYGRLNQLIEDLDAKIELVDCERTADIARVKADTVTRSEFSISEGRIKDELRDVSTIAHDCDYHLKAVDGQVKDLYDTISHVEDVIYKGV